MSFKIQTNFERRTNNPASQMAPGSVAKDENLIDGLRKLVNDYLEIVRTAFVQRQLDRLLLISALCRI